MRSLSDLPENARRYVSALEEHAGVPIVLVSVGPERTQTIERAWRSMRQRQVVPGMSPAGLVMPTRILVVGGGAREHALAWKLGVRAGRQRGDRRARAATPSARSRASARSRTSTRSIRTSVVFVARAIAAELVVIGPEAPLAAGVADALHGGRDRGLRSDRRRRADRVEQGVLPRRRGGGRRPDGPCGGLRDRRARPAFAFARQLAAEGAGSS